MRDRCKMSLAQTRRLLDGLGGVPFGIGLWWFEASSLIRAGLASPRPQIGPRRDWTRDTLAALAPGHQGPSVAGP